MEKHLDQSLLVPLLEDKSAVVRRAALEALDTFPGLDADRVIAALHDVDSDVREQAARCLGDKEDLRLDNTDIVSPLIRAMERDASRDVRQAAAESLGSLGAKESWSSLVRAILDKDPWVRGAALRALSQIDLERSVPYLEDVLRKESDEYHRAPVAWALWRVALSGTKSARRSAMKRKRPPA